MPGVTPAYHVTMLVVFADDPSVHFRHFKSKFSRVSLAILREVVNSVRKDSLTIWSHRNIWCKHVLVSRDP